MRNAARKDYITEEEFNRIVIQRGMGLPEDDSKGDSAVDDKLEVDLGEHYPEGHFESLDDIEDEDRPLSTVDEEQKQIETLTSTETHSGSSSWPDPSELSATLAKSGQTDFNEKTSGKKKH